MNKQNLLLGLVAVVLVLGVTFPRGNTVVERIIEAGASAGPNYTNSYQVLNGMEVAYRASSFQQATTTVCALRAPENATSTLAFGSVSFAVSSTSATTVTVAKATTAFATTTLLRTVSIAAGGQSYFPVASTTASASVTAFALAQTNETFAPGEYLVVGMAGGIGTFSPTGGCNAQFVVAK